MTSGMPKTALPPHLNEPAVASSLKTPRRFVLPTDEVPRVDTQWPEVADGARAPQLDFEQFDEMVLSELNAAFFREDGRQRSGETRPGSNLVANAGEGDFDRLCHFHPKVIKALE
jgi:hypothetical protein